MFYHALTGGNSGSEDLEPVLLWENTDVTASFDAQTINLDLTDYAGVIIDFNRKTTNQKLQTRFYMKRNDVTNDGGFYACANQTDNVSRKVSLSDTGVQFYKCNDAGTGTADNTNMIPTKIYGIKNYIVEPAVGDLLWTNPTPTANFGAQKISVNLSKAKGVIVEFTVGKNDNHVRARQLIYKGETMFGVGYTAGTYATSRNVTAVENDGVTFATGYKGSNEDTGVLIPYKIYAIN